MDHQSGKGSKYSQPIARPSIASHIRRYSYMGSGCGIIIVDAGPSSSGQLPVPVALNAMKPTLFTHTIQHMMGIVNSFFLYLTAGPPRQKLSCGL